MRGGFGEWKAGGGRGRRLIGWSLWKAVSIILSPFGILVFGILVFWVFFFFLDKGRMHHETLEAGLIMLRPCLRRPRRNLKECERIRNTRGSTTASVKWRGPRRVAIEKMEVVAGGRERGTSSAGLQFDCAAHCSIREGG